MAAELDNIRNKNGFPCQRSKQRKWDSESRECRNCKWQIKTGRWSKKRFIILDGRKTCPLKRISKLSELYLSWFPYFKAEELPCEGGKLDQPIKFILAMNILAQVENDIKEKENVKNN